jgi:hypothetical protein
VDVEKEEEWMDEDREICFGDDWWWLIKDYLLLSYR